MFRSKTSFSHKFGTKYQNCQFKLKFRIKTNSIGNAYFFQFQARILFLGKFDPKNQNILLILTFGT